MPTALIIGASRGIGREYARQLKRDGWKVYATARDTAALDALREEGIAVLKLDVSKTESLATLSWQLEDVKLDLAVYVAGVLGPQRNATDAPTTADFDEVMHTNVLGAMQATPLIAPLVEAARGKFVFITSGMGSIAESEESGPWWIYRVSKAALNMAVKSAAHDYPKATLVAMCPGWVQTDMGGPNATTPVDVCVADMRRVLDTLKQSDSGIYINHAGRHLPW